GEAAAAAVVAVALQVEALVDHAVAVVVAHVARLDAAVGRRALVLAAVVGQAVDVEEPGQAVGRGGERAATGHAVPRRAEELAGPAARAAVVRIGGLVDALVDD